MIDKQEDELFCNADVFDNAIKKASNPQTFKVSNDEEKSKSRTSTKPLDNKGSTQKNIENSRNWIQPELPLYHSDVHQEKDGIEMGVLENGTPYLSERGLIEMTRVARTTFRRISGTNEPYPSSLEARSHINDLLKKSGYTESSWFLKTEFKGVLYMLILKKYAWQFWNIMPLMLQ